MIYSAGGQYCYKWHLVPASGSFPFTNHLPLRDKLSYEPKRRFPMQDIFRFKTKSVWAFCRKYYSAKISLPLGNNHKYPMLTMSRDVTMMVVIAMPTK